MDLSLSDSNTKKYKHRLEQLGTLAGNIMSSSFTRKYTEMVYMDRWNAAVGYYITVIQFAGTQHDKI